MHEFRNARYLRFRLKPLGLNNGKYNAFRKCLRSGRWGGVSSLKKAAQVRIFRLCKKGGIM